MKKDVMWFTLGNKRCGLCFICNKCVSNCPTPLLSLVYQLLKVEDDASYKPTRKACVQLIDGLVDYMLRYEESLSGKPWFLHWQRVFPVVLPTCE